MRACRLAKAVHQSPQSQPARSASVARRISHAGARWTRAMSAAGRCASSALSREASSRWGRRCTSVHLGAVQANARNGGQTGAFHDHLVAGRDHAGAHGSLAPHPRNKRMTRPVGPPLKRRTPHRHGRHCVVETPSGVGLGAPQPRTAKLPSVSRRLVAAWHLVRQRAMPARHFHAISTPWPRHVVTRPIYNLGMRLQIRLTERKTTHTL